MNKKIAIIDADLVGRKKHRFPNLACMKISGYYKAKGYKVYLKLDYNNLDNYDKVFISKVFTSTKINEEILKRPNVEYGGTGFYYDKATPLPYEIEHHMPDYDLYKEWAENLISKGTKKTELKYYLEYSIGYTTRGCFRKCAFCVNKNHDKIEIHSPINEFLDKNKKYICLLDDNILGSSQWNKIFTDLKSTGKRFEYNQGMDGRLLTPKKCEVLTESKYVGDYIFSFDNIEDKEIIEKKLKLWTSYKRKNQTKFYVFCGFDRKNKYTQDFYKQDIIDTFERIKTLMKYKCLVYIMRHENYEKSPYRGIYINLARWCNQPNLYKKKSFREFCILEGLNSACYKYMINFQNEFPKIADKYFDLKFEEM